MSRGEEKMSSSVNLEKALTELFGYDSFRDGQKEIIESVLKGKNTLGTLPTGSGKSICYQLPALLLKGVTVIVSPLISLMVDQVKLLKYNGIKEVIAINSLLNFDEKEKAFKQLNRYKMIYCSPEMLQHQSFVTRLKQLKISLFVIDEAHCISQWGHEFRPDYLRLKEIIQVLNNPTVLALSATATPDVQKDIIKQLGINMTSFIYPIDRTNISYSICHVNGEKEKNDELIHVLNKINAPTMIYFSSRRMSEQISALLQKHFPNRNVAFYHGGMTQEDRLLIQQQFMNDQLDIICCTSAFGMGINKDNIRLVIHYHLPSTMEAFIQETGRGGRDGSHSVSLLLYSRGDELIPSQLIDLELPDDYLIEQFIKLKRNDDPLIETMSLTETQERFLNYHVEKLSQESLTIEQIINKIKLIRNERNHIKKNSIYKLIQWIEAKKCRRVTLFESFQKHVRKPDYECCDQCGFDIFQWVYHSSNESNYNTSWQMILEDMFNRRWKNEEEKITTRVD